MAFCVVFVAASLVQYNWDYDHRSERSNSSFQYAEMEALRVYKPKQWLKVVAALAFSQNTSVVLL